ncbi:MAG TPA: TonB family protein [Gemmatimonadaceae bacterium]|nr:TonB family protein [Gemmatimonadaceae bacterium]
MTTLLESGARPYGSSRGVVVSMLLHGVLIAAAILGTTQVLAPTYEPIDETPVLFVAPPPPEVHVAPDPLPAVTTPPKAPAPAPRRAEPARARPVPARQPQGPSTPPLVAPTRVPLSLPPIDLGAAPTVSDVVAPAAPEAVIGAGVGSSSGAGVVGSPGGRDGALGSGSTGRAYSESQVERIVTVVRGAVPRFPDALRTSGLQGEVQVRFIVGTNGRVEPGSIEVVQSPHGLFSESVRSALLDARFRPAEVGGRAVRQLVAQSFSFRLTN